MILMTYATFQPPKTMPVCNEVLLTTFILPLILPTAVILSELLLITNLLYIYMYLQTNEKAATLFSHLTVRLAISCLPPFP